MEVMLGFLSGLTAVGSEACCKAEIGYLGWGWEWRDKSVWVGDGSG